MSKKNIDDLINFVQNVDKKLFNNVKDLSSIDQKVLDRFISLKKNLDNLENLENFKVIIDTISRETNRKNHEILERLNYFRKLKII